MLILRNCKFVAVLTEGVKLEKADVLIENDKITAIEPCGTIMKEGAEELDLAGKTLIPGLLDMHVHLIMEDTNYDKPYLSTPAQLTLRTVRFANELLNLGYTTIRDVGENHCRSAIELGREIEAGRMVGPTIHGSGPILCPTTTGAVDYLYDAIDGVDSVRKNARMAIRKGAKFLKLYGSGSMMGKGANPGFPILEPEEISEAVKVAKNYGTYVAIHSHGATAIDNAVKCGVRTIEHASMISEDTLQYMEEHYDEVGLVPTLSVFYALTQYGVSNDPNDFHAVRARNTKDTVVACLTNAYHHNVQIGWGTDVSLAEYLAHPEMEFKLRKEWLNCSDEDIIKQATINSAKLMCLDDVIGTVKVGKLADLIIVDGDPSKDITVMYKKPEHVIKSGRLIR